MLIPVIDMKNLSMRHMARLALSTILLATISTSAAGQVDVSYQYNLANFLGTIPAMMAKLAVDTKNNEVFLLETGGQGLRVFNDQGMELHSYDNDEKIATAVSVAVAEDGDLLLLSHQAGTWNIQHCNYRGDLLSIIKSPSLPKEFVSLQPAKILYRNGLIYLADTQNMLVVAMKLSGEFIQGVDFYQLVVKDILNGNHVDEKTRKLVMEKNISMNGFNVDKAGNFYCTLPTLATVYRLTPQGTFEGFGLAGGAKGKFGVIAGIATDNHGNIYVSDKLRCVVMVFDGDFNFLTEFGYRGDRANNLVVPDDLVIDGRGYVYVSQAAKRGVSVFRTTVAEQMNQEQRTR